jgi:hypothetical protein
MKRARALESCLKSLYLRRFGLVEDLKTRENALIVV